MNSKHRGKKSKPSLLNEKSERNRTHRSSPGQPTKIRTPARLGQSGPKVSMPTHPTPPGLPKKPSPASEHNGGPGTCALPRRGSQWEGPRAKRAAGPIDAAIGVGTCVDHRRSLLLSGRRSRGFWASGARPQPRRRGYRGRDSHGACPVELDFLGHLASSCFSKCV